MTHPLKNLIERSGNRTHHHQINNPVVADHLESAALFRIFGFFFCFPFNIPYPFRAIRMLSVPYYFRYTRMLSIPYYSRAFYPVLFHVLLPVTHRGMYGPLL